MFFKTFIAAGLNWFPLYNSIKLAVITTVILFFIGILIAYPLAHSRKKFKAVFETMINIPLVIPPTVLGFYFIMIFGTNTGIGKFLKSFFGIELVFTFSGMIVISVLFSLPFMVNALKNGFEGLPGSLREASYTLGKSRLQTLIYVLLPNMKPSILTGVVLTFAHTLGAFGVILMVGGNIPGRTRVASVEIYNYLDTMNYSAAHTFAIIMFVVSFTILLSVNIFNKKVLNG